MGAWELLLVAVVLLLGLCGVLVPGVPGSWLVWAGVMWWALEDPRPVAWWVLVGATVVLLVSWAVRWSLPPRRLTESGATPEWACTPVPAPSSVSSSSPCSARSPASSPQIYLSERLRLGRHDAAKDATRRAMRSGGSSVLAELFACLLVAGAWVGVVFGG